MKDRSHGAVTVDPPWMEAGHDATDAVQLHVEERHDSTGGGPSEGATSSPPTTDGQPDVLQAAWEVLLTADDELERDLESPIRRARGVLTGVALGAIVWAVLLGAGALVIYL